MYGNSDNDNFYLKFLDKVLNADNYVTEYSNVSNDIQFEKKDNEFKVILPGLCIDDIDLLIDNGVLILSNKKDKKPLINLIVPENAVSVNVSMEYGVFKAVFNTKESIEIIYD